VRTFKAELQVRGYELDSYGHVNHAVYLNYAEFARWRMIEESTGSDYFKRNGVAPVIARAEVDYKEPCYLAEWLTVETSLIDFRKKVARFKQVIRKRDSGRVAAEVVVVVVVVDSTGKAVSLPQDFEKSFGIA
jgi:YbgC/YbaW family acyl-CoA thioester hydrolase